MRRKDRQRTEAFAWEVLKTAPFATVSMVTAAGQPYGVTVNMAADEENKVLYFHCAGDGEKWEILKENPPVCVSAVSQMTVLPGEFTVSYDSAVVHGRAEVVADRDERIRALLLLTQAMDPPAVKDLEIGLMNCFERTKIVKIIPQCVTGKQNPGAAKAAQD